MAEAYCKISEDLHMVIKYMMKKLEIPRSTYIRHLIHVGLMAYVSQGYLTFNYETMEFKKKMEVDEDEYSF